MTKTSYFVNDKSEFFAKIKDILEAAGFSTPPASFIMDNKEHRFDGQAFGERPRPSDKIDDWYRIEELDNGSIHVNFGSYHRSEINGNFYINVNKQHNDLPIKQHPYLINKRCQNTEVKGLTAFAGHNGPILVVPITDPFSDKILGIQYIDADGKKRFKKGSAPRGGCFAVWRDDDWESEPIIYVAEGLATAITIFEATGAPCLVGFGLTYIPSLIKTIAETRPDIAKRLLWASDTDRRGNTHVQAQVKNKALALQVNYAFPSFSGLGAGDNDTDFNDVSRIAGIDEVGRQLVGNVNKYYDNDNTESQQYSKSSIAVTGNSVLSDYFLIDWRYMIHVASGTRAKYNGNNKKIAEYFASNPLKVCADVVYNPGATPLSTLIMRHQYLFNIYEAPERGPINEDKGSALRDLILRTESPEDMIYLENWIANMLQNPTKVLSRHPLLSSLNQGTGKSAFARLVSKILGESNTAFMKSIDFENHFNHFVVSESQLIVIDEFVITGRALSARSTLKNMLSEDIISFAKKGEHLKKSKRTANFIMTTNQADKVSRLRDERRFRCIQWSEEQMTSSQAKAVWELINDEEAVNWLREYYTKMQITIDLNHAATAYESQDAFQKKYDCPVFDFLRNTNIQQLGYVTNAEFDKAYQESERRKGIHDSRWHDNRWVDNYRHKRKSAFAIIGWKATVGSIRIDGKMQRAYINPKYQDNYRYHGGTIQENDCGTLCDSVETESMLAAPVKTKDFTTDDVEHINTPVLQAIRSTFYDEWTNTKKIIELETMRVVQEANGKTDPPPPHFITSLTKSRLEWESQCAPEYWNEIKMTMQRALGHLNWVRDAKTNSWIPRPPTK